MIIESSPNSIDPESFNLNPIADYLTTKKIELVVLKED